jgi:hypothetical protein
MHDGAPVAYTNDVEIGKDTSFAIVALPPRDHQTRILWPGADLLIIHLGHSRSRGRILASSHHEATIELEDGSRWRMTPSTHTDPPRSFHIGGIDSQDWVVRSDA